MSNTESYWQDRVKHLESAIELACQTRNAAVDATIIVCKERDRLLVRLEEKTKEHGSDSMKLSIVIEKLEAELASAIARAEAAEVRLAMQSHDYGTARAAHAEAMELLREVRGPSPLTEYGLDELRSRIDAHLAKHGGGK